MNTLVNSPDLPSLTAPYSGTDAQVARVQWRYTDVRCCGFVYLPTVLLVVSSSPPNHVVSRHSEKGGESRGPFAAL